MQEKHKWINMKIHEQPTKSCKQYSSKLHQPLD